MSKSETLNENMRGCEALLSQIKKNREDIYDYLCEKAKDSNIFVGIRDNCFNLYYKGQSVGMIKIRKNEKGDRWFSVKNKFIDTKLATGSDYSWLSFQEFKDSYETIKTRINELDKGTTREKTFQQEIVLKTNELSSDWFCLDMEYNQEGERVGRFDIVAVSRRKKEGKHRVAIIELKVGADSYGTSLNEYVNNPELKPRYEAVRTKPNSLFSNENRCLKYGSGVVGHIVDFLRYLPSDGYQTMLKHEIPQIIKCQYQLGVAIPREIMDITIEDLASKPEVVFLCYTNKKSPATSSLKKRFGNQLFVRENSSDYALQKWICNHDISSILSIESDLAGEKDIISFKQAIAGEQYKFSLVFVDSKNDTCWLSLDRLVLK